MTVSSRIDAFEQIASAAFVPWFTRAKAVSASRGIGIPAALAELNAPAEIAAKVSKAAAESTVSQSGLAGSSTEVSAFISQASPESLFLLMLKNRAAFEVPLDTRVYLPSADVTAAVIEEGRSFPISGFDTDQTTVSSFKIGAAIAVTDELLRNVSPAGQSFLNTMLRSSVALAADVEMFSRLTHSGTPELESTGALDDLLLVIRAALDAVRTRATDAVYFGLSPLAANWIETLADLPNTDVSAGRFLGRPAVVTEALAGRRIAVLNARALVGAVDEIQIAASNSGTVQMVDSPTNDAITPAPTNLVSLFQSNATAIKVILSLAVESIRADGLAFVEIQDGSGS